MQVHFSTSDTEGWIRLWLGGVRETSLNGADTYFIPDHDPRHDLRLLQRRVCYRQADSRRRDIVYHTGFRSADSEAAL